MVAKKILVTTSTGFPRWKNDTEAYFIFSLNNLLAKKGYKIFILAPHFNKAKKFEVMGNLRVYRFQYFWPAKLQKLCYMGGILMNLKKSYLAKIQVPFFMLAEIISTIRVARKEKIEYIHANWLLPQGLAAYFTKKLLGIPYGLSAHAGDVFPMKSFFLKSILKIVIKNSELCTANSDFTKKSLLNVCKTSKISVIPMGVDLSKYYSKNRKAHKKLKYILYVGRLVEKKGVKYLIRAMLEVSNKFPKISLNIVGGGKEKENLQRLVKKLKLQNKIHFLGKVSNEELVQLYSNAELFVGPSIVDKKGDTEGLGVVFLESLACGTPVVASNVGGIPDIIKHNKTGLLVEEKNYSQLSKAIIRLLLNKPLSKKLARNGYAHVKSNFTWGSVVEKFAKLYSKHNI